MISMSIFSGLRAAHWNDRIGFGNVTTLDEDHDRVARFCLIREGWPGKADEIEYLTKIPEEHSIQDISHGFA
jgi:hypothetical protein